MSESTSSYSLVFTYEELGAPSSESKVFSASSSDAPSPSNFTVCFEVVAPSEIGTARLSLEYDRRLVEIDAELSGSAALLSFGLELSALRLFLAAKALNSGAS